MSKEGGKTLFRNSFMINGKLCMNEKARQIMWNNMIEDGNITIEECMDISRQIDAQMVAKRPGTNTFKGVPCLFCGKKFGTMLCAGCPNNHTMRYCSKECQLGAWPMHKAISASRQNVDEK